MNVPTNGGRARAYRALRESEELHRATLSNISDAVFLVDYLFTGTKPPPPSPGPDACGPDPSEDDLGCADSICP